MPEAASSVAAWSTEQMMLKMVQVRIATVVTRVVWMAVVLRCGKQMEILSHYHFSWIVPFQKQRYHIWEIFLVLHVTDNVYKVLTILMDLLLLKILLWCQFWCAIPRNAQPNYCILTGQYIVSLLFTLYKGLVIDWSYSKHVAKTYNNRR